MIHETSWKELICWFSETVLHDNQFNWALLQFLLLAFSIAGFLYFIRKTESHTNKIHFFFLVVFFFATLFLCRLFNLVRDECNTDESQWIAQANNFINDPVLWIKYFMPREYSRVFTIIPLVFLGFWPHPLTWIDARLLSLVMWSLFLVFFFASICRAVNKHIAIAATAILIVIISLMSHFDSIAYNSEIPVITLLMCAFYLFSILLSSNGWKRLIPFLLGLVLTTVPFAKEQSIYMVLIFELSVVILFVAKREWNQLLFLLAGNLLSFSVILMPYIIYGSTDQLISQLITTFEYSSVGFRTKDPGFIVKAHRFLPILLNVDFRVIVFSSFLIIISGCSLILSRVIKLSPAHLIVFAFATVMYAVTAYSVWTPGNFFDHYVMLFYFPGSLCLAIGLFILQQRINDAKFFSKLSVGLLFIVFLLQKTHTNSAMQFPLQNCERGYHNVFSEKIMLSSSPGDRILVWGWNNSYYVETHLLPGSRNLYIQFVGKRYSQSNKVLNMYEKDMILFKPKYFLELVGTGQLCWDTSEFAVSNFPRIAAILKHNYTLQQVVKSEKLYVRNEFLQ